MDKLFDDFFTTSRPGRRSETAPMFWQPAIEAYETDHDVVIRAELPGVDPNSVESNVSGLLARGAGEEAPQLPPARAAAWRVHPLSPAPERRAERSG